jgi:hypothetical protein
MKNIDENETDDSPSKSVDEQARIKAPTPPVLSATTAPMSTQQPQQSATTAKQQSDATSKPLLNASKVKPSLSISVSDQPIVPVKLSFTNQKVDELASKFDRKLNISTTSNSSSSINFVSSTNQVDQEYAEDIVDSDGGLSSDSNLIDYNNNEEILLSSNQFNDPG